MPKLDPKYRNLTQQYKAEFAALADQVPGWGSKQIWGGRFTFDENGNPLTRKAKQRGFEKYKISICTTCMNRLPDLQKTLPKNIEDNLKTYDKDKLEFLVLDYNSTKHDVEGWMKSEMMKYIDAGILVYCRTEEPEHYSMTKSRNLAFKYASGDIINNVDADSFTNEGFAWYLNRLANDRRKHAIFAKGRRMLRGRLGFWKKEFVDMLGGYDEDIDDYGHDDWDLMDRAWALGFCLMWFSGKYFGRTESKKHQTENMFNPRWKETEARNRLISARNIIARKLRANVEKGWGKAKVVKNFTEEL